jgi:HD-GYP domain-containing protein (c-di-GMP phosphodiesterase class II)
LQLALKGKAMKQNKTYTQEVNSAIKKRLHRNIKKLKEVTWKVTKAKTLLKDNYRKKIDKLIAMKEELQGIFKVNRFLNSTAKPRKIFAMITQLTCRLMHTDACILRLLDEDKKSLLVNSTHCLSEDLVKKIPLLKLGESICDMVVQAKKPLVVYDLEKDSRVKSVEFMQDGGFKSMLSVPIVFQGEVSGIILTYSKNYRHFTNEEIEVLSIFASQVAVAIQESKHYDNLHINYYNTIRALVLAIEAKDPYTRGHTERVTEYAVAVGRVMKIPSRKLELLRYAGEVHDVGKISIPDSILCKPGRLTPEERVIIEQHTVRGEQLLRPLDFLKPVRPVVRHHHEWYDGSGYPDRLKRRKIPLLSRILACADAFDAMTSDRPYRLRKLSVEEACAEIRNNSGTQFDPVIARIFIKTIQTQNYRHRQDI